MLQQLLLMVFIGIGVVCCQLNCPIYSKYKNDPSVLKYINGTFFKVYATGTNVASCQRQTFTVGPNNNFVGGYLKSQDWCLHLTNCDSSDPDHYECDIVPVTSATPSTLPTVQRNSIKLVGTVGTGKSLCLLYSYCRMSEEGMYVLCKNLPSPLSMLLSSINRLLVSLLNLLSPVPQLRPVSQANCDFKVACPPPK